MCGRYRLTAKERYLRDHFGVDGDLSWEPRWNIAPTQKVPIVPGQERTEANIWPCPLGADSSVGQKLVHWIQDHQRDVRDCCGETRLP
jgi:putative SOS response-associated peptidase YedK